MARERVDILLVNRGLARSREEARRLVMAGVVYSDTCRVDKAGDRMDPRAPLSVRRAAHSYASRGGLKLERALDEFAVDLCGRVVLDVGASTGGFTDCALGRGATLVYAVDVGYGQLAWNLRQDERVRVLERTNFRHVDPSVFMPRPDAAVMDVSFISVLKLLAKLADVLQPGAPAILLVKPQFEAGPESVGKGGIVRDPEVHERVLQEVVLGAERIGFAPLGLTFSPIAGGDGNIEFLLWLGAPGASGQGHSVLAEVAPVVARAHAELGRIRSI